MCGICGIIDPQGNLGSISDMNYAQRHRGPDDEGYLFGNTSNIHWQVAGGMDTPQDLPLVSHQEVNTNIYDLVLGSRRLAILDLSSAGHMPMSYRDNSLWIVHNGEIYNYRELRQELMNLGYAFQSDSDTEVILAAYAEWGVECLQKFNGMFAFALWDVSKLHLFCARDRFGVKPFYYYCNNLTFVFASEIKALLQHPGVPRIPNDQIIFDYLLLGLSDHTEYTFFDQVFSIKPGHYLIYSLESKHVHVKRWWDLEINPHSRESDNGNEADVYSRFTALFTDAVRLRLRSDVPVGSCLSGGLDSSSIVSLANRLILNERVIPANLVGERQKTFTARNLESEIDEYRYSHLVVQQTGAEENIVFPDADILWAEIESFLWHMDEPIDSTSQYLQWNVMRLARNRGVTVLLDGQGGDEILAGYYSYYPHYINQIRQQKGLFQAFRASWEVSRVGGRPVIDSLYENSLYRLPWRVQRAIGAVYAPPMKPGQGGTGLKEWELNGVFVNHFYVRRWQPSNMSDPKDLIELLFRDLSSTNLPKLLRYEDRNSMAYSLETRLPFLDYRLVEMIFSLPLKYRIQRGWNKWILRKSLSNIIPEEIRWRRGKLGYPTPEIRWMRQGSEQIRRVLKSGSNDLVGRYLDLGALKHIHDLSDAELALTPGLWRIVNLIIWMDLFINRDLRETANQLSQAGIKP